jgi:site-specific DNA-methyltransferase (adenine-specific)
MSLPKPYYADESVTLYLGDCRELLPVLSAEGMRADCVVTDPPYESTSLAWDRWPDGWLQAAAEVARSMWCFLPLRQFAEPPFRGIEFRAAGWRLSQDLEAEHAVWEKHNGSSFHADRFKRVHEIACHWYRGDWGSVYHEVPTTLDATARTVRRKKRPPHTGHIEASSYASEDGGPRLMRSVLRVRSMHGTAIHPSEKPTPLLEPMIAYACPPGGLVVDMFAGSGSTLDAARSIGRRAIGFETDSKHIERAAGRLCKPVQARLFGGDAA